MLRLLLSLVVIVAATQAVRFKRTIIRIKDKYAKGDEMFIRGGYDSRKIPGGCGAGNLSPENHCIIPIVPFVKKTEKITKYSSWVKGDQYLDFFGPEPTQGMYGVKKEKAEGTPMVYVSNQTSANATYKGLWIAEFDMDCDKTFNPTESWFEFRAIKKSKLGRIEEKLGENLMCIDKATGVGYLPFWYAENHWGWCGRTTTVTFNVANNTDCYYS